MNIYGYIILITTWIAFSYCMVYEEDVIKDLQQQLDANERICEEENKDASYIIAHHEMLLSIIKDGASYKEAVDIIDTAMKEGIYPKL